MITDVTHFFLALRSPDASRSPSPVMFNTAHLVSQSSPWTSVPIPGLFRYRSNSRSIRVHADARGWSSHPWRWRARWISLAMRRRWHAEPAGRTIGRERRSTACWCGSTISTLRHSIYQSENRLHRRPTSTHKDWAFDRASLGCDLEAARRTLALHHPSSFPGSAHQAFVLP